MPQGVCRLLPAAYGPKLAEYWVNSDMHILFAQPQVTGG
jgi:hypothetical protein